MIGLLRIIVIAKAQPTKYKKLAHCLELLEKPVFVEPSDAIPIILKAVLQSPSKRVFVSMDKYKILGIISPRDLLTAFVESAKTAEIIQSELKAN
jgi:hypothetical protein